jgi:hypothetical protein
MNTSLAGSTGPARLLRRVGRRLRRLALQLATARARWRIGRSGLFDVNFYAIENPELGRDLLLHFCTRGGPAGRRPNLYFDPAWYAATYLGPEGRPGRALVHYIRVGEAMGLRPTPSFDPAWYAQRYALARGVSPLRHYLQRRRTQRFAPNPHFDLDFYLAAHGEEIGPNRDPYAHFLRFGAARGLDPSPGFDSGAYRAAFMGEDETAAPDAAAASWTQRERRTPLVHYLSASVAAAAQARRP